MRKQMLDASVIVPTYNRLKALKLVLEGFRRQRARNFEVIVADDGSTDETRDYLSANKDSFGFPLRHIWHEDKGFRKSRILNRAIAECESELVIFNDGDCIPHERFVDAHVTLSEKGRFLISRSVIMSEKFSNKIDVSDVAAGRFDRFNFPLFLDYLFGQTRFFEYSLYVGSDALHRFITGKKKSRTMFGGNFSVLKEDLIRVNGFNEEFVGWGSEDGELGFRLVNSGLVPKVALLRAINYHYFHSRSEHIRNDDNVDRAGQAREENRVRCVHGLDQHPGKD